MGATALVGCQWGDEGKGKIVDLLTERADLVARFQGGANAGHTVVIGEHQHILHLLPVGILRPGVVCVLGNGMVIDPAAFLEELETVRAANLDPDGRIRISPRAHVILSYHKAVESVRERAAARPIGTTLRGIGPAYETKAARVGVRVGDFLSPERLVARIGALRGWALAAGAPSGDLPAPETLARTLEPSTRALVPFIQEPGAELRRLIAADAEVLLEGAQGTLLDLDHGTYPYVTSSSTSVGGALTGLGLPPSAITRVVGVTKAYTTRVGEGPFPTEFEDAFAATFREHAKEFGATTGRPRRCGWLDGVLLRHAAELNGLTALVVTKLDCLDGLETLRIATAYENARGRRIDPDAVDLVGALEGVRPVYEEHPGWIEPTCGATSLSDLPENARRYLDRIEAIAGVPIVVVSTGNRRDQAIVKRGDLLPPLKAGAQGRARA